MTRRKEGYHHDTTEALLVGVLERRCKQHARRPRHRIASTAAACSAEMTCIWGLPVADRCLSHSPLSRPGTSPRTVLPRSGSMHPFTLFFAPLHFPRHMCVQHRACPCKVTEGLLQRAKIESDRLITKHRRC